jgi:hypothetical protein
MGVLEIVTILVLEQIVVLFVILRLEPRIPIAVCLGLLVTCAIAAAMGKDAVANQIAIYAYYSLVAGVLLLLVQQVRAEPAGKLGEPIGGQCAA